MNCGDTTATIGDGSTAAQCGIARQEPAPGGTCNEIVSYIFQTDAEGGNQCEFITEEGEQTVMNVEITFKREPYLTTLPATFVEFGTLPDQAFAIGECAGLTLIYANNDPLTDPDGPDAIPEVQTAGYDSAFDLVKGDVVPGNTTIEFACYYSLTDTLLTDPVLGASRITEIGIQFWGDINFSRR